MSNAPGTKKSDPAYYIHDGSTAFRFQLSGDLSGDGVRDLEQTWRTASSAFGGRPLVVDLSSVTGMDHAGRELLETWQLEGASMVVTSSAAKDRIESMMDRPVTLLGTNPKQSSWPLFRVAPRWMMAFLVVLYPAAAGTVSRCPTAANWPQAPQPSAAGTPGGDGRSGHAPATQALRGAAAIWRPACRNTHHDIRIERIAR